MLDEPSGILIVDDEESISKLFTLILRAQYPNVDIESVTDGQVALQRFCEQTYRVIISDVNLPGLTGEELYREVELQCEKKGLPMPAFIFCTGRPMDGDVSELVSARSTNSMLSKPVTRGALLDAVRPVLG